MIGYRPLRNSDLPALAEIWRAQATTRGLAQPMTVALWETLILAKPYFDRAGLIVAEEDGRPIGFAHAAFGGSDDGRSYAKQLGVVCMVMVDPRVESPEVASTLLTRAEDYLRSGGAQVLYGGGIRPLDGFYLGLYGGSELPGVLDSDARLQELFRAHQYREIDRTLVFQRSLSDFRAPIDRRQIQIRRRTNFEPIVDPRAATWWEACTIGGTEHTRFELVPRDGGPALATATFWDMRPLADTWGATAAGLYQVQVDPQHRRQGLATYLLSESFRQLREANVTLIEAQSMQRNTAATGMYEKLGFKVVDEAAVFRREGG